LKKVEAILFDLDDTLLNRDQAVENLFMIILNTCYEKDKNSEIMLKKFKEYDRRHYGNQDKTPVVEAFFDEFPPSDRIPDEAIQDFWNTHFPSCFSIDPDTLTIIHTIKEHVKIAIITNGSTQRQLGKIRTTNLNLYFDTILISEEVGISKPDQRIFEMATMKLNVQPENVLFVGDNLVIDIDGCQHANMKGIWFNPYKLLNDTEIKPYGEIDSLEQLLHYFT